jgi:phosphonate transport system substrate-binding protein
MRVTYRAIVAGCLAAFLWLGASHLASADWRDDFNVLRVGVLAGTDSAYRIASLEPFRVYLQDRIGVPVEIVPAGSYDALIDAQISGGIDYAIYSATSFATAAVRCECIEPIGAPVAADGALGFHSILVAAADAPIESLADARGKSIALAGADSVAGRLVPLQAFAAEGIVPPQYFTRVETVADPKAAIQALLAGDVDVAVGWSSLTGPAISGYDFGVLTRMVADGSLGMDSIKIIWRSELIPFGPHAVRADIPPELRSLLSQALLAIASEDPRALDSVDRLGFGGGGFASPGPDLYGVVLDLVKPRDTAAR